MIFDLILLSEMFQTNSSSLLKKDKNICSFKDFDVICNTTHFAIYEF